MTKPHAEQYNWLVRDGNAKDIDPTDTDRWCEYIVYKVRGVVCECVGGGGGEGGGALA